LKAALTGLLPTPPTPVQITKGLSLWLDEKRGSRHGFWDHEFVVFEFEDGTTVRMLAKRLLETPDDIVKAASALPR
jgi:hypothetical protein